MANLRGLIYGVVIILVCAYTFHQINSVRIGGECLNLPTASRWFVAFMNLELLLYLGLVLVKLPLICRMQAEFMPNLTMECEVQRFMYLQRVVCSIIAASLCIWAKFNMLKRTEAVAPTLLRSERLARKLPDGPNGLSGPGPGGPGGFGGGPGNGLAGNGLASGRMGRSSFAAGAPYPTRQSLAPPQTAPRSLAVGHLE
eukprot:g24809.t1